MIWRLSCYFILFTATLAHAATATLTWDPGAGGGIPTGYSLERKDGANAYAEVARPTTPPVTQTVVAGPPVCWRVRAFNALGYSGYSNELCVQLPSTPVNLAVTIGASPVPVQAQTTVRRKR